MYQESGGLPAGPPGLDGSGKKEGEDKEGGEGEEGDIFEDSFTIEDGFGPIGGQNYVRLQLMGQQLRINDQSNLLNI